jgi:hypothetical protein
MQHRRLNLWLWVPSPELGVDVGRLGPKLVKDSLGSGSFGEEMVRNWLHTKHIRARGATCAPFSNISTAIPNSMNALGAIAHPGARVTMDPRISCTTISSNTFIYEKDGQQQ